MYALIIDDNASTCGEIGIRNALALKGKDPQQYKYEHAKDAATALKLASKRAFDIIIADLNLDSDDIDALDGLAGFIVPFRTKDRKTPIIAMNWNEMNRESAINSGANEFWQKGSREETLARLIAKYIR